MPFRVIVPYLLDLLLSFCVSHSLESEVNEGTFPSFLETAHSHAVADLKLYKIQKIMVRIKKKKKSNLNRRQTITSNLYIILKEAYNVDEIIKKRISVEFILAKNK